MISQTRLNLKTNRVLKISSHCWIQRWNYCCNYCREGIPASESVEDLIGLTQLQRLLNRACLRTFGAYAKRTCSVYVCAFTYITYKWRPRHRMILMHTMLHLPIYQFIHNSYSTYTNIHTNEFEIHLKNAIWLSCHQIKPFPFVSRPRVRFPARPPPPPPPSYIEPRIGRASSGTFNIRERREPSLTQPQPTNVVYLPQET